MTNIQNNDQLGKIIIIFLIIELSLYLFTHYTFKNTLPNEQLPKCTYKVRPSEAPQTAIGAKRCGQNRLWKLPLGKISQGSCRLGKYPREVAAWESTLHEKKIVKNKKDKIYRDRVRNLVFPVLSVYVFIMLVENIVYLILIDINNKFIEYKKQEYVFIYKYYIMLYIQNIH